MTVKEDIQSFKRKRFAAMAQVLIPALEDRQFEVYYCETGSEAADIALDLIPEGNTVSWGGSMTLEEIGLLDKVKEKGNPVIDRASAATPEERMEMMRQSLLSDVYLTSFNAMSIDGAIYNIDGFGNRVSAITFGPKQVIAVVGMNKVSKTREGALLRAQEVAAQINAARFNREGTLFTEEDVTEDLPVKGRICNVTQEITYCGIPKRIKIILVGEELGF